MLITRKSRAAAADRGLEDHKAIVCCWSQSSQNVWPRWLSPLRLHNKLYVLGSTLLKISI
jgi:hypothetical protein